MVNDQDRYLFGQERRQTDQIGYIEADRRAIFGRSYAAELEQLKVLASDEAIKEADTLLLTIPNTLGVEYNTHVLSSILKYVAPGLGWPRSFVVSGYFADPSTMMRMAVNCSARTASYELIGEYSTPGMMRSIKMKRSGFDSLLR